MPPATARSSTRTELIRRERRPLRALQAGGPARPLVSVALFTGSTSFPPSSRPNLHRAPRWGGEDGDTSGCAANGRSEKAGQRKQISDGGTAPAAQQWQLITIRAAMAAPRRQLSDGGLKRRWPNKAPPSGSRQRRLQEAAQPAAPIQRKERTLGAGNHPKVFRIRRFASCL
jgi:hypothetical protein